ncbi:MAG: AbrB/MazE/SpoVT family DNA-binding domain-containing protein [Candidatus Freyarchaeota archaeon]|nr:AbrB/MazE/SpoVT family DNA-binding domain-containing protein [Candidatus Jordarchaeia archaeon]
MSQEDVSFIAQLRSAGGSGTSVQVTIPKDIASLLRLKEGDYVRIAVKKITVEKGS